MNLMLWVRRAVIVGSCLLAVAIIGYFDYASGFEKSMVLFYLAPIAIATWYANVWFGLGLAGASVTAWGIADLAAGIPRIPVWNFGSDFLAYGVFVVTLALLRNALAQMQHRVDQRTAALRHELAEKKRLEIQLVAVGEHERQRVARDLHDNLSQHLTGTSLLAQGVVNQLQLVNPAMAQEASKIVSLINQGITRSRDVARGLFSFELDADGLSSALDSLAASASRQYGIECTVTGCIDRTIPKPVAAHMYWIANEAVRNAAVHSGGNIVTINMNGGTNGIMLRIQDNGHGIAVSHNDESGIGLKIMQQRAELAGGRFEIRRGDTGGTVVQCDIPTDRTATHQAS